MAELKKQSKQKDIKLIKENLSMQDYHSMKDVVGKSDLDLIDRSPAHYAYRESSSQSRAMVMGSAIHSAILEPDLFANEYKLLTDVKDRRSSAYKEAIKHRHEDFVLTGPESQRIKGMQSGVSNNQEAFNILTQEGRAELSVITKDPETGVGVRCRIDWLTKSGHALDLKKTQDAREAAFARSVAAYRYHVQEAFYRDVWKWETGEELSSFRFLAIEENLPHASVIWTLDDEAVSHGRSLYRKALNTYAECLEKDSWPFYTDQPEILSLPSWAAPDIDEDFVFTEE